MRCCNLLSFALPAAISFCVTISCERNHYDLTRYVSLVTASGPDDSSRGSGGSSRRENLIDGSLLTSYRMIPDAEGLAEWSSFVFRTPVSVSRIALANGAARSADGGDPKSQSRDIKRLLLCRNFTDCTEHELRETPGWQILDFEADSVKSVKIIVLDYHGQGGGPASLAEIAFFGLSLPPETETVTRPDPVPANGCYQFNSKNFPSGFESGTSYYEGVANYYFPDGRFTVQTFDAPESWGTRASITHGLWFKRDDFIETRLPGREPIRTTLKEMPGCLSPLEEIRFEECGKEGCGPDSNIQMHSVE